jgi:hypothetical protein
VLFLHCGLPKTGTTTLQAVMASRRDRLASAGLIYPDRWGIDGDDTHNRLGDLLNAARRSGGSLDELSGLLAANAHTDVLISSEGLTTWLWKDTAGENLIALLEAAEAVTPVTCIWTLRRLDEMIHSIYLRRVGKGVETHTPSEVMEWLDPDRMFANMRYVQDAHDHRTAYLKYEPSGTHNVELVRMLGLPDEMTSSLERELGARRRLNLSRTRKQLASLMNVQAVCSRAGLDVTREELLAAYDDDGFGFEDDEPCELAGREPREGLHERALAGAGAHGIAAYCDFFGDARVEPPAPTDLEPDALTERDLRRLVAHLTRRSPHAADPTPAGSEH